MKIEIYQDSDKQSQMLKLLQFGTVMVFVDSRHPDVMVPGYLKGDYQLRLNFDYAYQIDDFRVLPDRIEASLSFNKKDYFCILPFEAVYLLVNHSVQNGALFVQTVPMEMLQYFADEAQSIEEAQKKQDVASTLSVVSGSGTQPSAGPAPTPEKEPKKESKKESEQKKTPRKKGHLRLVK